MKKDILSDRYLASFLNQLYMLVRAGIPLDEAVSMLYKEERNDESKKLLKAILKELVEGKELYIALESTKSFPYYMLKMVKVGETTGNLEDTLKALYEYYERVDRINTTIKNSITYPLVMACMMFAVIVVLVTKVMPIFSDVYEQLGSKLSGFSLLVLNIGKFLNNYSMMFVALIVIAAICLFMSVKTDTGREKWRNYFSKKEIYKELIKSRFASVMSMGLGSGLNLDDSLELAFETVNDSIINEKGKEIRKRLGNGEELSTVMELTGIFNSVDSRFLSIGVRTGNVASVMKQIADRNEDNFDEHINSLISKVEPTLVIILAIITGVILLSVMIPLASIISLIG